jgi:hypothetical protein
LIHELRNFGAIVSWHDESVKNWNSESSAVVSSGIFDITVLAIRHKEMDLAAISKSAPYIFDCVSAIPSANQI